MILNSAQQSATVSKSLAQDSFGLNLDRAAVLMEMLSKGIYSNPKESAVREYTSNAWDAHKEAGVDKNIVVDINTDTEGDFISIEDFGTGLSEEKFKEVYLTYLGTTKDQTNDALGAFGIGSKSGFSVADAFYVINTFEGVRTVNLLYKDGQTLQRTVISSTTVDEDVPNGIKVKIYIDSTWSYRNAVESQLPYFENVSVYKDGEPLYYFEDVVLYKGKNFTVRNKMFSNNMHIKLGVVKYPINFRELGLNTLELPIALNFEIGELSVTPSREHLNYDSKTKDLILNRIEAAINEIVAFIPKDNTVSYDSLKLWKENYKKNRALVNVGEVSLDITQAMNELNASYPEKFKAAKEYSVEKVYVKGFRKFNFKTIQSHSLDSRFDVKSVLHLDSFKRPNQSEKKLDLVSTYHEVLRVIEDVKPSVMMRTYLKELGVQAILSENTNINIIGNVDIRYSKKYSTPLYRKHHEIFMECVLRSVILNTFQRLKFLKIGFKSTRKSVKEVERVPLTIHLQ
jgi:hypothetical protein